MKRAVLFAAFIALVACGGKKEEKVKEGTPRDSYVVLMQGGKVYKRFEVPATKLRPFPYNFTLVDQDGKKINLKDLKGKILVVGYIYTHCPDICPFITSNMKKVQKIINSDPDLKSKVLFLSITFDPERDTPNVLKEYASLYKVDESNWRFLTGEKSITDSIMKLMGIEHTRRDVPERNTYFIDHTDRIHVVDQRGFVRGYFVGSQVDPDSVATLVRQLAKNQI
ncbi:MAG: SCO family protein [Thermotogae bacterium]|nr:SCO family protein [Thermotogota bacterium]